MPLARGVECPAQRAGCRTAVRRQNHQHDDRNHVRRHCQKFDGNGNAGALQIQLQLGDSAEKISTQQHPPGLPGGKDNQCESDPADTRRHALGPLRHADKADVGAAQPRQRASEHDCQRPDANNLVAKRVRRVMVFADGAQNETCARELQYGPDRRHNAQTQI